MTDRLTKIREAVERDGMNIEDAYADRAWLLSKYDSLTAEVSRLEQALKEAHTLIPTTWLDPLLTGPSRVISRNTGSITNPEVEELLRQIKAKVENHAIDIIAAIVSGSQTDDRGRLHDERCAIHQGNGCNCLLSTTDSSQQY